MIDMMQMMGKVKEMQDKLKQAQDTLSQIEAQGESGAGLVKATVNGNKEVIKIEIDDSMVKISDKEAMQDLIVAAINKALSEVTVLAQEHIQGLTGGVPDIAALSNLLND